MPNIHIACAGFSVWEAAGLTSEPAEEVVVMLCRQVGEDVFDPTPKLEAESESEQTFTSYFNIRSIRESNILVVCEKCAFMLSCQMRKRIPLIPILHVCIVKSSRWLA